MPDPEQIPYVKLLLNADPDSRGQVPIFGDVYEASNVVIDFYEYGCYPHWTVWVETFLPAAGELVLQLVDFGWGDILRGYFRPNSVRGLSRFNRVPGRGKKGKTTKWRKLRRRVRIPEVGNSVGKALPGSKFFRGRKVTGKEAMFWRIDGIVQRGLWFWLIADVGSDFIVNWLTAIMESEACRKQPTATAYAELAHPQTNFMDLWENGVQWNITTDDPEGTFVEPGIITVPPGADAAILVTADGSAALGDFSGVSIGIFRTSDPTTPYRETPWPVGPGDDPNAQALFERVIPDTYSIKFLGRGDGLTYHLESATVQVSSTSFQT